MNEKEDFQCNVMYGNGSDHGGGVQQWSLQRDEGYERGGKDRRYG